MKLLKIHKLMLNIIKNSINHFFNFGNLVGIFHKWHYFFFLKLKQQNNLRLLINPLENGDPYRLGHTFKYDILIQLKNSQLVKFINTKKVWKNTSGMTKSIKQIIIKNKNKIIIWFVSFSISSSLLFHNKIWIHIISPTTSYAN